MLLGGGYHGQRLNKIYRGKLHPSRPDPHSGLNRIRFRKRHGTRDSRHSSPNDQAIRLGEARRRTLWRLCDPGRLHLSHQVWEGVVRRYGRRRRESGPFVIYCIVRNHLYTWIKFCSMIANEIARRQRASSENVLEGFNDPVQVTSRWIHHGKSHMARGVTEF